MSDSKSSTQEIDPPLALTPLHAMHVALGARMAPFAAYDMPVQYPLGILGEHKWTRESAGLFDVSHMGQVILEGAGAAAALETLLAADIIGLAEYRTRYSQFLNADGGILDDLMATRLPSREAGVDRLFLVVNAACKHADVAHLRANLSGVSITTVDNRALLAIQGPKAAEVVAGFIPGVELLPFMGFLETAYEGADIFVSRSGYTGEDGFEISLPPATGVQFAQALLADQRVKPIGLGARDSLRLEAGLCLYGHDIDETTSPVEGGLTWSIGKRRRADGGFPGFERIAHELKNGPSRKRVGLLLDGRQPAREGAEIADENGAVIGKITSGGFAPSLDRAIAMGYVAASHAAPGAKLNALVRGKPLSASVVPFPFFPHRYVR
ncbi:MAG: glycine cleavage system aminomethyltransferase GcvT [Beijerinckiaceae bacterium]|nr:glycine cleavage system aminomethyltransferase GcvT [Beijerinckiaceae bacterium]